MTKDVLESRAGYMVHDLGPRRFHPPLKVQRRWWETDLGAEVMDLLRHHGLDQRDAYLSVGERDDGSATILTDAGPIRLDADGLASRLAEIDALFALVAAGVAQERLARAGGWRPGKEMPHWAITASDVLVRRVRSRQVSPARLWNAGVHVEEDGYIDRPSFVVEERADGNDPRGALPAGCYVARYSTGMHIAWDERDLSYREHTDGAKVTLPEALLPTSDPDALVGRTFGEVCTSDGELREALAGYRIVSAVQESLSGARSEEPRRTTLLLAVPMRTLAPIPDAVLAKAGVAAHPDAPRDAALWLLTDPELLLRHRPRGN